MSIANHYSEYQREIITTTLNQQKSEVLDNYDYKISSMLDELRKHQRIIEQWREVTKKIRTV